MSGPSARAPLREDGQHLRCGAPRVVPHYYLLLLLIYCVLCNFHYYSYLLLYVLFLLFVVLFLFVVPHCYYTVITLLGNHTTIMCWALLLLESCITITIIMGEMYFYIIIYSEFGP